MDFPPSILQLRGIMVIGSANGLLGLCGFLPDSNPRTQIVALSNPLIRKSFIVAVHRPLIHKHVSFGVCHVTKEPKIIRI